MRAPALEHPSDLSTPQVERFKPVKLRGNVAWSDGGL
jgi:hypothetical protein